MRTIPAFLAGLMLLAACGSRPAPDLAALGQQILDAEAAEAAGWAARDVDAIMNAYASDTIVLLGGAAPMDRTQLRALFERFLVDPNFSLTFRSDPPLVAAGGDIGITVGTYEVASTNPDTQAIDRKTGRHLMTWKLQDDGAWRAIRQMTVHDR
ncbi:MAG: DUF4440 domain-containing protein [Steroidobacteraceae bacterium]